MARAAPAPGRGHSVQPTTAAAWSGCRPRATRRTCARRIDRRVVDVFEHQFRPAAGCSDRPQSLLRACQRNEIDRSPIGRPEWLLRVKAAARHLRGDGIADAAHEHLQHTVDVGDPRQALTVGRPDRRSFIRRGRGDRRERQPRRARQRARGTGPRSPPHMPPRRCLRLPCHSRERAPLVGPARCGQRVPQVLTNAAQFAREIFRGRIPLGGILGEALFDDPART